MCGIVGFSGSNNEAVKFYQMDQEKLEYRGYDSAGVAFINEKGIQIEKKEGKLKNLVEHCKH